MSVYNGSGRAVWYSNGARPFALQGIDRYRRCYRRHHLRRHLFRHHRRHRLGICRCHHLRAIFTVATDDYGIDLPLRLR